jgi:hypothetical protein
VRKSKRRSYRSTTNAAADEAANPGAPVTGEARAARIGVLSPAGKVVDHDRVLTWAHDDPNRSIKSFSNIGDSFVYESSLRILDYSELVPVMVPEDARQRAEHIEKLNQLDFIFLRGSNYINMSGKWDAVTDLLEETTVPIIAMGIGVQAPDNASEFVNASTRRFLNLIADRSTTIGIRGAESERALRSIGITNTRIFGCPTVFRHRQPEIHLPRVGPDQIERLGFTLQRNTHGRSTLQRYLLRTLADHYDTTIFCAGELEEKAIYYAGRGLVENPADVLQRSVDALTAEDWFFGSDDPLVTLYKERLAVFEAVGDFEARMRTMSAATGFRLHGNLMALANSVPALYVTYDSRTREFVDTLGIPFVESKSMDRFSFRSAWERADFDKFERTYAERFRDLTAFLEENGMPHRLGRPAVEVLDAA